MDRLAELEAKVAILEEKLARLEVVVEVLREHVHRIPYPKPG